MGWGRAGVVAIAVAIGAALAPAVALANDPADSITVAAPAGPNEANYPITFTGGGSADGSTDDGGYTTWVVWAPSSAKLFNAGCPQSYAAATQAIDVAGGGPYTIGSYEAEGVPSNLTGESGPYTYSATANGGVVPTLTQPGAYLACAYLTDSFSETTYAVSAAVPFTVVEPAGSGRAPGGFGGPRGRTGHPSDLTLKVALSRRLRDPGHNLLEISGREPNPSGGPDFLDVDVNLASRDNGCAGNDEQNSQITHSDGGTVLAQETVSPNSAGTFRSPVALTFRRRVAGTYVVCVYLEASLGSDVAVGFDRITVARAHHKARSHKKHTHKKHRR